MISDMHILFVDDNPGDCDLAREALSSGRNENITLHTAGDGDEGMRFLRKQSPYQNVPRPHLILLDLNMPRRSGLEMLKELKADDAFRTIPVVIFSSSTAKEDLAGAYLANANAYVAKPSTLEEFLGAIGQITYFWEKIATVMQ